MGQAFATHRHLPFRFPLMAQENRCRTAKGARCRPAAQWNENGGIRQERSFACVPRKSLSWSRTAATATNQLWTFVVDFCRIVATLRGGHVVGLSDRFLRGCSVG